MDTCKRITIVAASSLSLAVTLGIAGFADRIDPSLIPPDVTLSTGSSGAAGVTSSANTPGIGAAQSAAAAGVAGAAPAATAPAAPTPKMGQPLPPGAAPAPPPPPTGSSGTPPSSGSNAIPNSNYSMFQTHPGAGPSAAPDVSKDPIAVIDTPKGRITIRLFKSLAPKTVDNFVDLASKGFFNGLVFHRVEPGFCIQGGDPLGNGTGMYIDQTNKQPRFIPLEIATALKHNAPGVVAMAHGLSPNSASSQFYITLSPQPSLDGKYAIFGGVMSGMDVVRSIVKGDKMTTVSVQMP